MSGILNLDKLKELKTRLVANIDALNRGLVDRRKKLKEYDQILTNKGTDYDLDYVQKERDNIFYDVQMIEKVIAKETARSMQCDLEIQQAMSILAAHGVQCTAGHGGQHDWQITETFPSGNWKKRHCRRCDTKEKLGHD